VRTSWLGIALMILLTVLSGCTNSSNPPTPSIEAGKLVVPAVLSTHCWGNRCADYPTPPQHLKAAGYRPAVVPGGATLDITFTTPPKDGIMIINQWVGDKAETLSNSTNNLIVVPAEPGVYTYAVAADWKGGSASYAFQVEVR
jgi:hypothetical protein